MSDKKPRKAELNRLSVPNFFYLESDTPSSSSYGIILDAQRFVRVEFSFNI